MKNKYILLVLVALALSGCASKPVPVKVYSVNTFNGRIGAADEGAVSMFPEMFKNLNK